MAQEANGYISRGNMAVVLSAAAILLGGAGWFITNQQGQTDRRIDAVHAEVRDVQARLESNYLRKDEHNEFRYRIDRDIGLIREEQQRRSGQIVPRTEHEARWSAYEANQKLFSDRLNEVRNLASANSTVPLRDEMTRVEQEITDMRKLLIDRPNK